MACAALFSIIIFEKNTTAPTSHSIPQLFSPYNKVILIAFELHLQQTHHDLCAI